MIHHLQHKWKCKWDKGVPTHTFTCTLTIVHLQYCKPTPIWEQRTFKGLTEQLQK